MLPLLSLIRGIPELILAFVFGGTLILLTVKRLKLIGKEEADMLGSIPIPAARRILQFVSA